MTQKRGFIYKIIEEGKSPLQQRTYQVWNTTGATYHIPESRIEPTCQPLKAGATGIIEQDGNGRWYWIKND